MEGVACVNVCYENICEIRMALKMYLFYHVVYSSAHTENIYESM